MSHWVAQQNDLCSRIAVAGIAVAGCAVAGAQANDQWHDATEDTQTWTAQSEGSDPWADETEASH